MLLCISATLRPVDNVEATGDWWLISADVRLR